jgi:NADH-quinone oxidoreductase subunit M
LCLIVLLACIGLPGLNTFVGTFLILLGVFWANPLYAVFAALGSILMAAAMVRMFRHVMLGEVTDLQHNTLRELKGRELIMLAPVVVLIIWMGVYPAVFLKPLEAPVHSLIVRLERHRAPHVADMSEPEPLPSVGAASPHRGERTVP